MDNITPDVVRSYKSFTPNFLCGLSANIYRIKFKRFKMRDIESGFVLFEVCDDTPEDPSKDDEPIQDLPKELEENIESSPRTIRYHFGPDFLDLKDLGSSLTFSVGKEPVKDFLMIERHYFKDILIKSFEFKFDFCIPNSTNMWESIYTVPDIDPTLKQEMIDNPWMTRSDSFYFVGDKLVMHNKALYNYGPFEQ